MQNPIQIIIRVPYVSGRGGGVLLLSMNLLNPYIILYNTRESPNYKIQPTCTRLLICYNNTVTVAETAITWPRTGAIGHGSMLGYRLSLFMSLRFLVASLSSKNIRFVWLSGKSICCRTTWPSTSWEAMARGLYRCRWGPTRCLAEVN